MRVRLIDMVFPGDANHHGTLFGGVGLAHLDKVAFLAASRHARRAVVTAKLPDRGDTLSEARLATLLEALDCLDDTVACADDGVAPPTAWLDGLAHGAVSPERCPVCSGAVASAEMRAIERRLSERPPAVPPTVLSDAAAIIGIACGTMARLASDEDPSRVHSAIASACTAVAALVSAVVECVNSADMPCVVWSDRARGRTTAAQTERCPACGRSMPTDVPLH